MDWINYHHLLYFWTVAREGTVARASQQLRLAQPTLSGQIRALEDALGERLFMRSGRNLVLTDVGQTAYRYASEIFALGREMMDALKGRPTGRPLRLIVGVADAVPKLIAYRLLRPALVLPEGVQVICHEGRPERLLADLAQHSLDLVLTDAPVGPSARIRAFNHLLGSCGVTVFGAPALAAKHRKNFPRSLDDAPFLMPGENAALRRSLEQWLEREGIRPKVVGEFEDSALLKVFGQGGMGLFPAPSAIEQQVRRHYRVSVVGHLEQVVERFYAVSAERRLKHPAVLAISEAARQQTLF